MVIRCVLFDAVGTLIYPDPPVAVAYRAVGQAHGCALTDAEIGQRFREAFRRQESLDAEPSGCLTGEARELERWQTIVGEVFSDVHDASAIFSELWQHFAEPRHWRLFEDVAETWQALAERGVTLGIGSNFDRRLRQVCAGLPPLDQCDRIFVSSEMGFRKPAVDFFRQVEISLKLAADQILLVGDDWSSDYLAAQSAGWKAVFLDRCSRQRRQAEAISSLGELLALVIQQ
jgi:putative hydrolase of the HAD superfamily